MEYKSPIRALKERNDEIYKYILAHPEMKMRDIAKAFNITLPTIYNISSKRGGRRKK